MYLHGTMVKTDAPEPAKQTGSHSRPPRWRRGDVGPNRRELFHDGGRKEEKVILFNYESRTCIIDVDIFPPFFFFLHGHGCLR